MEKRERLRACAVCVVDKKLLVVHLRDPASRRLYVFPPGGAVESGETPAAAAARETLEETGFRVEILPAHALTIRYDFTWENNVFDCRTTFFPARRLPDPPLPVSDRSYHEGVSWLSLSEIPSTFGFHPAMRDAILAVIAAAKL